MEATERTPLCTLAKALATGKTASEFNVLDKNEIRVDTYLLFTESRWRGSLIHGERLPGVAAQVPKTVFSSALITKVFAANYKKVNEFLHWLIKLAMCIGRKHWATSL